MTIPSPLPSDLSALLARIKDASGPSALLDGMFIAAFDQYDPKSHPDKRWHADEEWYQAQDEDYIERHYLLRDDGVISNPDRSDCRYYTSSIDAALALVERLLPGDLAWRLQGGRGRLTSPTIATIEQLTPPGKAHVGIASTLPLAILSALLSALIAQAKP